MRRDLRDMIVVITGASAGIGRVLAEHLAERGARLVLGARRLDRLEALNDSLGGGHLPLQIDVSDPADCQRLVDRAFERFGRIDTLVCNAGYGVARPTADMSVEELRRIFDTNVFGTTDCIRAAVPRMREQDLRHGWRGQIVIVSSAMARRAVPWFGAYAATKAAQLSFAEALRVELRPARIAVTSVHPVGTSTEFFDQVELQSGTRIEPATTSGMRQTPRTVVKKMLRAIQHPRPELWPSPLGWIALTLAMLTPRLTDRFLARYFQAIAEANRQSHQHAGPPN